MAENQNEMESLFLKIPDRMYFKIGDVASLAKVEPYVLRYWETEFKVISPEKSKSNQRMYRRVDVENILLIKKLLYVDRFSIEGAKKKLKEIKEMRKEESLKKEFEQYKTTLNALKNHLSSLVDLAAK